MSEDRLKAQLIRDEGIVLHPYRDSIGKLTIGAGRNLDDVGISKVEAAFLLDNDIARSNAAVLARIDVSHRLDEVRRAVLFNMCFNMGIGNLLKFVRFLKAVEMGDWQQASLEMLDSKWAEQVGPRAHRLAKQMVTGEWQ